MSGLVDDREISAIEFNWKCMHSIVISRLDRSSFLSYFAWREFDLLGSNRSPTTFSDIRYGYLNVNRTYSDIMLFYTETEHDFSLIHVLFLFVIYSPHSLSQIYQMTKWPASWHIQKSNLFDVLLDCTTRLIYLLKSDLYA